MPGERLMRLGDERDQARLWKRDAGAAALLSVPPVIFWVTSLAYLTNFGPDSTLGWWLVATALSVLPPILLAARSLTSYLRDRALAAELRPEEEVDLVRVDAADDPLFVGTENPAGSHAGRLARR